MPAVFPFDVPVVRKLDTIELSAGVTFFVGENGSGKSTLLEAMALAAELPTVGSNETRDDTTLTAQRALAKHLTLSWTSRSKRGFFLRAEDFFGYAKRLARIKSDMREELERIEREYEGRSDYAKGLAMLPALSSLGALESQLSLMTLMLDMVEKGGQFVIATHSPILLAFPDAAIFTFDRTPPERVAFEDLEHVNLTRAFLNDPGSYLRRLR